MADKTVTKQFDITGVVQGVGFRPFLFRLAHEHNLKGEVYNDAQGVTLILEGNVDDIACYHEEIYRKKPPIAIIEAIDVSSLPSRNYPDFRIVKSRGDTDQKSVLISPDVSVCDDCLFEMRDSNDRRYGYPFINCTHCGPRYTIIDDVPYDRPKTSMASFTMCPSCQKEYDDPLDRRFHAQPNACPVCGPHLDFVQSPTTRSDSPGMPAIQSLGNGGEVLNAADREQHLEGTGDKRAINETVAMLKRGKIVAIKGLGGFHLAVDALNEKAIKRLRSRKQRPEKPLALMVKSVEVASKLVHISEEEKKILTSHARPILLLEKRLKTHFDALPVDCDQKDPGRIKDPGRVKDSSSVLLSRFQIDTLLEAIAPKNRSIGVMLPYTPFHELLLQKGPSLLVMTSGNRTGEPLSIANDDALDAFSHIADGFLIHNRDIFFRADDSIVQYQRGKQRFIRRSRGYAPLPVFLKRHLIRPILACGGGLKSTICLANENRAFLSPHIGDLDNEKVFTFFRQSISHLSKILDIVPDLIAHDLHPGYMSTAYALERGFERDILKRGVRNDHEITYPFSPSPFMERGVGGEVDGQVISDRFLKRCDGDDEAATCRREKRAESDSEEAVNCPLIAVQHHHAHALSCMAENGLNGEVIAVTLDGTGLGTDGHIWGGEVLVCDEMGFERKAHLSYLPMPGGDVAVKEPWRMAISSLYSAFQEDIWTLDLPMIRTLDENRVKFILQMIDKGINVPLTSSCGRLFDLTASMLSLCHQVSFEGQAAMALEAASADPLDHSIRPYPFSLVASSPTPSSPSHGSEGSRGNRNIISMNGEGWIPVNTDHFDGRFTLSMASNERWETGTFVISTTPMIKMMTREILSGKGVQWIGARFHRTLIEMFVSAVNRIVMETGLDRVVLSGGVFHNGYLLSGMIDRLEKDGLRVYSHSQVPCGDGGIALGQILAADAALR